MTVTGGKGNMPLPPFVYQLPRVRVMEIILRLPEEGSVVSQLKDAHKAFLDMAREPRVAYYGNIKCRDAMLDVGHQPVPVAFFWSCTGTAGGFFTLRVASSADFSDAITVTTAENGAELENLRIGARYFWQVSCGEGVECVKSRIGTFFTEDRAPRIMRVGGVKDGRQPTPYKGVLNMRDLGGYRTISGRKVRQGMIYRSAGLNNNATPVYYAPDELAHMEEHRVLSQRYAARQESLTRAIDAIKTNIVDSRQPHLLPFLSGRKWVVFRPADNDGALVESRLSGLDAIPALFLGAPAEEKLANDLGTLLFAETREGALAVLMQEFHSDNAGCMLAGCGADWYWDLWVNGIKIYDMLGGNAKAPVGSGNHTLLIPVKKGRNLLAAQVGSGSASWTWCFAAAQKGTMATQADMLSNLLAAAEEKPLIVKEYRPGASRLNGAELDYLLNHLGIKTDIDFRGDAECFGMTGSPLGTTVPWVRLGAAAYGGMHTPRGQELFRDFFRTILNRDLYPFIMHCIGGKDRTGSVAFVLSGLLGVAEEDLFHDWEMSGFFEYSPGFDHNGCFFALTRGFEEYPGEDINQKIEAYARHIGITAAEIAAFRTIML